MVASEELIFENLTWDKTLTKECAMLDFSFYAMKE